MLSVSASEGLLQSPLGGWEGRGPQSDALPGAPPIPASARAPPGTPAGEQAEPGPGAAAALAPGGQGLAARAFPPRPRAGQVSALLCGPLSWFLPPAPPEGPSGNSCAPGRGRADGPGPALLVLRPAACPGRWARDDPNLLCDSSCDQPPGRSVAGALRHAAARSCFMVNIEDRPGRAPPPLQAWAACVRRGSQLPSRRPCPRQQAPSAVCVACGDSARLKGLPRGGRSAHFARGFLALRLAGLGCGRGGRRASSQAAPRPCGCRV